jgi:hypothetical protein
MASRIGKGEWTALYVIFGTLDVVEFGTDLFLSEFLGAPEATWEVLDRIVGVFFVAYLQARGVSILTNFKRLMSLVGQQGLEALTGGGAPAWVIEVWYLHRDVRREAAMLAAEEEQQQQLLVNATVPLYVDGVRQAENGTRTGTYTGSNAVVARNVNLAPKNVDGIRPAGR